MGLTGSAGATYQAVITKSIYYKISGNSSFTGTIPAGGNASFNVTWSLPPRDGTFPGVGALPAYEDTLTVTYGDQTFIVPISMSVDGTVLSFSVGSEIAGATSGPQFVIESTSSIPPLFSTVASFFPNPANHFSVISSGLCSAADNCWIRYDGSASCGNAASSTLTITPQSGGHVCYSAPPLSFPVTGCN